MIQAFFYAFKYEINEVKIESEKNRYFSILLRLVLHLLRQFFFKKWGYNLELYNL